MTQPGRVGRVFWEEGAQCTKARRQEHGWGGGQGWYGAVRVGTIEVSNNLEAVLKILNIESAGKP